MGIIDPSFNNRSNRSFTNSLENISSIIITNSNSTNNQRNINTNNNNNNNEIDFQLSPLITVFRALDHPRTGKRDKHLKSHQF